MLSNASRDAPGPPPPDPPLLAAGAPGARVPPHAASGTLLHPVVAAAARGELPGWAVAGPTRREHMARVSGLLDTWAAALDLSGVDRARWRAAGWLHDVLREERPDHLRSLAPPAAHLLPDALLHGPAAAERLRAEGVVDEELLAAIAAHSVGGAVLGQLGRALYVADYLEPGRSFARAPTTRERYASLRDRMPSDFEEVLREVVGERIRRGQESGRPIAPETLAFADELALEAR